MCYGCENIRKNIAELKPVGTYLRKGIALDQNIGKDYMF